MSDTPELRIAAIPPTGAAEPVQHAYGVPNHADVPHPRPAPEQHPHEVAASTDGQLQNAYAEFVVDPHTHDVVVRIRDAATDRILNELPSPEVQAISRGLRDYAEMLARQAALRQAHDA